MQTDRYIWQANYLDGTSLRQIDSEGNKFAYGDIQRNKLESFDIVDSTNDQVMLRVTFTPGDKLIWRRRVEMNPESGVTEVCHIVGKQATINGENRQVVFAFFESDGRTEVSDKFDETHPWFFPVQIHPNEGEE